VLGISGLVIGTRFGAGARAGVGARGFVAAIVLAVRLSLVPVAAAAVVLLSFAGSAMARSGDPLVSSGQLFASDTPTQLGYSAMSGGTAVAFGSALSGGRLREVVYVFAEPPDGWSGTPLPVATLVPADGGDVDMGGGLAISGGTVVVADENKSEGAYVFTEPAGGWSGTVHESALLTVSGASNSVTSGLALDGGSLAIDGGTVVASGFGRVYVFTEPAGGWSGTVHESATLTAAGGASSDRFGASVAISGQTIAVSAPGSSPPAPGAGRVYVFTRPAARWSGTLHENATLSMSNSAATLGNESSWPPIAVSGDSVYITGFAFVPGVKWGVYVFTQPAGGWSGTVHETAVLSSPDDPLVGSGGLAASDGTVVAASSSALYVFTEPSGGWATTTSPAEIPFGGGFITELAVSGETILAGQNGAYALDVVTEPAAGWSSVTQPTATLGVNGPGGLIVFASAAISDGVAVAGAPDATVSSNQAQGAVYLYTRPAGGWSAETEAAKLIASDGHAEDRLGRIVVTTGDTVIATGGTGLYVFTKPPGGWSGTLHESAKLTLTDPAAGVTWLAISGDTLIATGGTGMYVFTKPTGGWSGTISPSATLTTLDPSYPCLQGPYAVAIDGTTIAAACSHEADVYTEPAGGWSGTISPSATLPVPSSTTAVQSVAVVGRTIAVASGDASTPIDPVLFNEPASGWSGTIQPSAKLRLARDVARSFNEYVVASGNTIAALVVPDNTFCEELCGGTLYGFSRPFGGWSGTINGASTGDYPGVFATDGGTIATGGNDSVDLFTIKPGRPSATSVSLTRLSTSAPTLQFTLQAGQSAAPIRSLQLTLPGGLRFTHYPRAVHVSAAIQRVRVRPGTLVVTLRRPAQSLAISITRPALSELGTLTGNIRGIRRYNRTHKRKHTLEIRLHCIVTDATGHHTNLTFNTRIS
jgi:FG-GAP repeat